MNVARHNTDPLLNHLLAHLPASEWKALEARAVVVSLRQGELVFSGDEPVDLEYFPLTCIISMIAEMANGDECEYGCIGREGMLGLQVALGAQPLRGQALCQLAGEALRLDGSVLRDLSRSGTAPELQRLLLRYAQATINVLAQSAACNALHSVTERTARWLLMSRDRAGSDEFTLTQEFLAKMLGVRRASVTAIAGKLQDQGIIKYRRSSIHVVDTVGLEAISCECYKLMRDEYALVYA